MTNQIKQKSQSRLKSATAMLLAATLFAPAVSTGQTRSETMRNATAVQSNRTARTSALSAEGTLLNEIVSPHSSFEVSTVAKRQLTQTLTGVNQHPLLLTNNLLRARQAVEQLTTQIVAGRAAMKLSRKQIWELNSTLR